MPLRKSERWAVGLTALSLALTLGYHAGTARRAPEVTVRAESLARPRRQRRCGRRSGST